MATKEAGESAIMEESEFESVLRELRVCLELECGSTKGRHFLAKKKNLTFKLSKGDQFMGAD